MHVSDIFASELRWTLGLEGVGLWAVLTSYSMSNERDRSSAFLPSDLVRVTVPRGDRRNTLKTLLSEGVLREVDGGYELLRPLGFGSPIVNLEESPKSRRGKAGADARWAKHRAKHAQASPKHDACDPVSIPVSTTDKESSKQFSEDVERLCSLLSSSVMLNGAKQPRVTDRWRQECDRLINRDGRSPEQIEQVIRWSQADVFWRSVILSMPKLRQKFDQLWLRMQAQGSAPATQRLQNSGDLSRFDRLEEAS